MSALLRQPSGFEGGHSALPVEDFDSNPIGVECEERVVTRHVAILLGREVNARAARQAACVRLINLLLPVNFDGKVLDANAVVAVSAAIRRSEPEPIEPVVASLIEVDDLLGSSIGRIPDALSPAQGPEQLEVEGERPFHVGDCKINVVYSLRWHRPRRLSPPLRAPVSGTVGRERPQKHTRSSDPSQETGWTKISLLDSASSALSAATRLLERKTGAGLPAHRLVRPRGSCEAPCA